MAQVAGRKSLKNVVTSPYEHWKPLSDSQFYGAMGDFVQFCKESIILDKNGRPVPMHHRTGYHSMASNAHTGW